MAVDKYAVAGLLLIILLGVYVPYATSTQVYASDGVGMKSLVAEKVINMVRDKIDGLLALAERHGITIPENLTDDVDMAYELLSQAAGLVDSNPKEAIKLSIQASLVFSPVARYIIKNLPEGAISVIINERLEKAIEVKLGMVERLNNTLNWLDEKGIPYSDDVRTLLSESYELLTQAQNMLESGEYNTSDVARLLGQASMKIGLATKTLYKSLHRDWVKVNMISHAGIQMKVNIERLIKVLNVTILSLEEDTANTSEISETLRDIASSVERIADIINRHLGAAPEDSNITRAMIIIRDALYDVADLLNEAADYLDSEDTNSAIAAIQAAIDRITEAVDEAGDYLRDVRYKIMKLREIMPQMMEHLRMGLKNYIAAHMGRMVFTVGMIDISLKTAYRKYSEGHLSKAAFLALLDRAEDILTTILDRLNNTKHPPELIIRRINSLLDWIETVRSEVQSS